MFITFHYTMEMGKRNRIQGIFCWHNDLTAEDHTSIDIPYLLQIRHQLYPFFILERRLLKKYICRTCFETWSIVHELNINGTWNDCLEKYSSASSFTLLLVILVYINRNLMILGYINRSSIKNVVENKINWFHFDRIAW